MNYEEANKEFLDVLRGCSYLMIEHGFITNSTDFVYTKDDLKEIYKRIKNGKLCETSFIHYDIDKHIKTVWRSEMGVYKKVFTDVVSHKEMSYFDAQICINLGGNPNKINGRYRSQCTINLSI